MEEQVMSSLWNDYKNIDLTTAENIIKSNLNGCARNFVAIGFYLKDIRDNETFLSGGYESIWDFAQDKLQMAKSTVSRFMAINDKFSVGGNSPVLMDKFLDFGSGKLQEMLTMTDEEIENINPETTVKEIREIKRSRCDAQLNEKVEKVILAQVEIVPKLSAVGKPMKIYPEGSVLSTPGCEGSYSCFSCGRDCQIRQEKRYCRDAPLGNPFPCTTMNVHENLEADIGDKCMFVNLSLADVRAGDKEPIPCCMECTELCGFRCNRSAHEVKSSDQDAIDFTRGIDSLAKEYEAKGSCPQGVGGCMRNGEEGEDGKKICTKCWKEWLTREKILASAGQQDVLNDIQESVIESPDIVNEELENVTETAEIITSQDLAEKGCTNCKYDVMPREDYFQDFPATEEFPCDNCDSRFNNWLPNTVVPNQDEDDSSDQESEVVKADIIKDDADPEKYSIADIQWEIRDHSKNLDILRMDNTIAPIRYKSKLRLDAAVALLDKLRDPVGEELEPDQSEQPDLPVLKNNDQRKDFIDSYTSWPVWINQELTGEWYYRYNLSDKVAIVVKVSRKHEFEGYKETKNYEYGAEQYYLLGIKSAWSQKGSKFVEDESRTFYECNTNKSALTEYLKEFQKK